MISGKKGAEFVFTIIIIAAILLVTLIIILIFAGGGFNKLFGGIGQKIEGSQDCDKDNTIDLYDKCPCDPSVQEEWPENLKASRKCPPPECTSERRKTLCPS